MNQPFPPPPSPYGAYGPPPSNGVAIASLIVGVVAIIAVFTFIFAFVAFVPGVVAIVLGVIGLRRAGEHPTGQGRGSSVAGIVLGVLGTLASIAAFAIVALFVASSDFEISDTRPAAPDDYELSDRTCRVENRQAVAGGVLTNTSEGEPGFVITVRFLDGQRVLDTATDELAANLGHGQSWDWEVAIPVDPQQVNTDSLECRVERVDLARLVD